MRRRVLCFVLLSALLVALFFLSVSLGSLKVTPAALFRGFFVAYDPDVATIYDLRLPRIVIAMLAGAALAVSGALMQAVMKNPIADPGVIGVSSGAAFTAVVVTAFAPSLYFFTPVFAFAGGLVAFLLVYGLAWDAGLNPLRLILVGVAVNAMFAGLSEAFNSAGGGNLAGVAAIVNGNITMKTWDDAGTLLPYVFVGLALAFLLARRCDLLMLEDRTARSLGVDVNRSRLFVSFAAVLLASGSTAIVGVIGFLGLIAPHIARILVGSGHRALLPFSMLLGAFILLLADTLGRTAFAPYEISAGILMAVIGGPFFVFLLKRSGKNYG
ncbi:MAG: iron ABC transporter permease [Clostridiales Family XIII bacterium]|jgi:iron complex transport system permease protein|nr:iron ABC transporter permease [Clostridiales Family XIII bacterium]